MKKSLIGFSLLALLVSLYSNSALAGWYCEYAGDKADVYTVGSSSLCIAQAECIDENGRFGSGQIFCQAPGGTCPDATTCVDDQTVKHKEVTLKAEVPNPNAR